MQGCGRKQTAVVKLIEGGMKGDKQEKHGFWLGRDHLISPPRGTMLWADAGSEPAC